MIVPASTIESEVEKDLLAINYATISTYFDDGLELIFDGLMSMEDFAKFVYFEYFAKCCLASQEKLSVDKQAAVFENRIEKINLVNVPCQLSESEKEFANTYNSEHTIDDMVSYRLPQMLYKRPIPLYNDSKTPFADDLLQLKKFAIDGPEKAFDPTAIGKGYFYQLLLETIKANNEGSSFRALQNSRKNPEDHIKFYSELYSFVHLYMSEQYVESASEDDLDTYLSCAVALYKLENRYKYSAILNYALALESRDIRIYELDKKPEADRFSRLPFYFYSTLKITDENIPYRSDELPSPIMMRNQYLDFFLSASDDQCRQEEFRYYSIVQTAENVRRIIAGPLNHTIEYTPKKFAWFINHQYNIFDLYEKQHSMDLASVLTWDVSMKIQKIVRNLYDGDKSSLIIKDNAKKREKERKEKRKTKK